MQEIVTRFPPSPTGHLHVGGARTALFNWLWARNKGGRFIVRIEDTDQVRSSQEMTEAILEALSWLGLDWDEGPYFQSKRLDLYQNHIDYLLQTGQAYFCQCTSQEVEQMREEARARGEKPKYSGRCRELDLGPGPDRVIRFKSPLAGQTIFRDELKGVNRVENQELDDFVLRRADGSPTYNLAVVVDDATMGVSHILRGDDHLSNTPKQVLLYQALGYDLPSFGHVPMILGPDKKRLSKRHGAMSVLEYRKMGYLPQALINYLVRLGWSLQDQEIFTLQELIQNFDKGHLGRSACVFNPEKLDWVNFQHIKASPDEDLAARLPEYLRASGLPEAEEEYLLRIVPLLKPRANTLLDMARQCDFFLLADEDLQYEQEVLDKFFSSEVLEHLEGLLQGYEQLQDFSKQGLEELTREYLQERGIKFKLLAQPLRVALTAKTASPGVFEIMEVLGRERVSARLARVLQMQGARLEKG
ncbi:MAG: glutamate--tRNA ligase [Thermodesulfobacteriota bacterium]